MSSSEGKETAEAGKASTDEHDSPRGELEEFILETITQVAAGVAAAQEPFQVLGGQVNPVGAIPKLENAAHIRIPNGRFGYVQTIDFDIAITRQSGEAGSVGGGVRVVGLSLGGKREATDNETNVSRIRFSLPVVLPGQPNEETEQELKERRKQERDRLQKVRRTPWLRY
jgi:hypothetical protein